MRIARFLTVSTAKSWIGRRVGIEKDSTEFYGRAREYESRNSTDGNWRLKTGIPLCLRRPPCFSVDKANEARNTPFFTNRLKRRKIGRIMTIGVIDQVAH
jgi:hypothetical protein